MDSLEQRFLNAAHAAEVDSTQIRAVEAIAEEALAAKDTTLACRALMSSAYLKADNGWHSAALSLLDRAEALGKKARLPIAHEAEYGRGHVYFQRGDFEDSFQSFSALALGRRFKHLRRGVRCNVLTHLSLLCHMAQADDAALHCLALVDHEFESAGVPMAGPERINRAHIAFWCWVFNAPEFASMRLFGPESNLPPASRGALLQEVVTQCEALLTRPAEQTQMQLHEAHSHIELVQALQHNDVSRVWRAVRAFEALSMNNLQYEIDNWTRFLAVSLLLDATSDAQLIADRAQPLLEQTERPSAPIFSVLIWQYLLSQLAQRQGRYEQALKLYQRFAAQATEQLVRINAARSKLMTVITLRPGARALHQPNRCPAYYEHARTALLSAPQTPVAEVAQRVGVSERALREAFKVHAGVSPKEFQLSARLDGVRQFLQSGKAAGLSVEEIAAAHDFSHASRFASAFKRHVGRSVTAYRDAPGGA
jgi:AraC-like DNA-binding protein